MPIILRDDVIERQYIQNAIIAYNNRTYIADDVFPIIRGNTAKAKIPKYLKGAWDRDEAEYRADGVAPNVSDMTLGSESLDAKGIAHGSDIGDQARAESLISGNFPFLISAMLEFNMKKIYIKKEKITSDIIKTTAWSGNAAPGEDAEGLWGDSTAANDTFATDIDNGVGTIIENTGYKPTDLVLDWNAWKKLQRAPKLVDAIYPTKLGADLRATPETVAAYLGLKRVTIAMAVENTDEPTVAGTEFTGSYIWGRSGANNKKGIGFLFYRPDSPAIFEPSAGYQYLVNYEDGSDFSVWDARDDKGKKWTYFVEQIFDIAAVGIDCGYMWYDTATT